MSKRRVNSYSKFRFEDIEALGLSVVVTDLFGGAHLPIVEPSPWLIEALRRGESFSLNTEKAKSEFIIGPFLSELHEKNPDTFAVYSGFNFNVDEEKGLQGFCDFLLTKLPLNIVPQSPIIAVVEAKLNQDISSAVPQCAAEMYASRLWNEKRGKQPQSIYGAVTTGENWLFLRYGIDSVIEVDKRNYPLFPLRNLLGAWQYIIDQYKD